MRASRPAPGRPFGACYREAAARIFRVLASAQVCIGRGQGHDVDLRFLQQSNDGRQLLRVERPQARDVAESNPSLVAGLDGLPGNIFHRGEALIAHVVGEIGMHVDR